MFAVIAQGGGFYGSAFFTTNLDLTTIRMALEGQNVDVQWSKRADGKPVEVANLGGGTAFYPSDTLTMLYPPDTHVMIRPWEGEPQPKPVLLFDSGHADLDLYILGHLQGQFGQAGTINGARFARFVERPGWRLKARQMGLGEQVILQKAMKSAHPPKEVAD